MKWLRQWLDRLVEGPAEYDQSPRKRIWRFVGAGLLFVAVVAWAYSTWDGDLSTIEVGPTLLLLLVGVPIAIGLVAWEQHLSYRLAGQERGWLQSTRVGLAASAANLLPVPGSLIVRTAALKQSGASLRRSLGVTSLLGVLWIGATATFVGLATMQGFVAIGLVITAVGLVLSSVVLGVLRSRLSASSTLLMRCVLIAVGKVLIISINVWLAFRSLGGEIDVAGAVIVSSSAVLATAAGFFPGGLGLRELLSSLLAGAAGYDPATAVLATALERLVWMLGLALAWFVLNLLSGSLTGANSGTRAATTASAPCGRSSVPRYNSSRWREAI